MTKMAQRGGRLGSLALVAGLALSSVGLGASAAGAAPSAAESARTKIFGAGYDNPNEVRGRWIGNTTWAVSYGGTMALHDTSIEDDFSDGGDKYENNGFVSLDDILTAKPDVIFQDHTHFDQNRDAAEIAAKTGAQLVTTLSGCGWTKYEALKGGFDAEAIRCNLLRDAQGQPFNDFDTYFTYFYGGQGILFTDYGTKGAPEAALPGGLVAQGGLIKHSGTFVSRPYPENLTGPQVDPLGSMREIMKDGGPPPEGAKKTFMQFDAEGGNVFYLVKYRDFTVARHGSTGPTNALEPGATKILDMLRSFGDEGDRVDLHIGGITEVTNYVDGNYHEDAKQHAGAVGAKLFFPTHHNNWFPYWMTMPAATYWPGMQETWADGSQQFAGAFPKLCMLTEENFGTLWQFKVNEWKGNKTGTARPLTGPNCYTG